MFLSSSYNIIETAQNVTCTSKKTLIEILLAIQISSNNKELLIQNREV